MAMRRVLILPITFCLALSLSAPVVSHAQQIPGIGSITGLVKRVIKAIDLKVQRLQNSTIALQNAQKALENTMSKLHLNEIAHWAQQQKDLYEKYFNELWQVKTLISGYHRVKEISQKQVALVNAYKRAWGLLQADQHFTPDELGYMGSVYSGILQRTLEDAGSLLSLISSFTTQMSDADRMQMVDRVAKSVDAHYNDLKRFNAENAVLSLQRSKDEKDAEIVRWMYGL
ncbi:conjugal transfer protein TraI [Arachidicoccus terrestris]|uniref:conjugal transfer protein TraI n=1 Tax=Arachidicoccus terrestris TaxID=2875539 RepID=UPI001CC7C719|nr:conjugal transfer protein TraI [Arachidicoccus terrestris]UAY55769.1 conjugal transfer protein TraI [Arachidicoccus terrestris]